MAKGCIDICQPAQHGEAQCIGIEALLLLKREGDALHSRKLRSFDEPPFR